MVQFSPPFVVVSIPPKSESGAIFVPSAEIAREIQLLKILLVVHVWEKPRVGRPK